MSVFTIQIIYPFFPFTFTGFPMIDMSDYLHMLTLNCNVFLFQVKNSNNNNTVKQLRCVVYYISAGSSDCEYHPSRECL